LDRKVLAIAKGDRARRQLMTVPRVGAVVSLTYRRRGQCGAVCETQVD